MAEGIHKEIIKVTPEEMVKMGQSGWHFNECEKCGRKWVSRGHDFDCSCSPPEMDVWYIQVFWCLICILAIPLLLFFEFKDFIKLLFRRK